MEAFFIYFLKVNGLLVTFFLAYYFLLRKETFFNKNRWFLLLGLFASVLLPLITFTKTIWVDPSPVIYETVSNDYVPYIIENKTIEEPFDWNSILFYVYLGISVVFIVKILIEILSFFRIIKFGKRTKTKEALLIDSETNENPFSFFNHIVFNSQMFSEDELQHIISHEKIHVKEKHSIDLLVSKVFCAVFWVNPIMWFYQKEMLQNLEYIADSKASVIALDKINYQKTLLKVVTNQHQLSITNQFYQSLIKKRIVMLNTNPSNQRKSWKYALILPVLSAFMLLFQVETVAQVKSVVVSPEKTAYAVEVIQFIIDKKTSNAEIKKETERLKKEYDVELEISKIKRNKQNEIIALEAKFVDSNNTTGRISVNGDEAIEPILFFKELGKNGKIGFDRGDMSTVFANMDSNNSIKSEKISWDEAVKLSNQERNNTTIFIDGIKSSQQDLSNLDPEQLFSLNVIKENKKNIIEVVTIFKSLKDCKLLIINGKEYLQSEIPKDIIIKCQSIRQLNKEEGIKKFGQKAKDGVLIFEGKSTFSKKDVNSIPFKKINSEETNQIGYVFDKISSDNELENDVKALKEKYNIDFKVLHKKRNSKGEIIELKLSFDDNKGSAANYEQVRSIAIRPVFLKVKINESGKNDIGFYDNHEMVTKPKDEVMERKISIIENLDDNAIIYVDGNLFSKDEVNELDVNGLNSIKILKDKESLKKYKVTNQKEVIVIETNWKTKK